MLLSRETCYCQAVSSSQLDLYSQWNASTLFCKYWQTDFKVYMEKQKTQNSQHNIEEEQSWKTDSIQLHDLLQSYNKQDSVVLVEG